MCFGSPLFWRVCEAVNNKFFFEALVEFGIIGQILVSTDATFPVVLIVEGSSLLDEDYAAHIDSGNKQKLIDFSIFILRLQKRCLRMSSSSVFASLNGFSMTLYLVTCLKVVKNRDWMMSRTALRRAIITWDLSMPGLLEVLTIMVGIGPPIVSYLKETGKVDKEDSLVVQKKTLI